MLYLRRYLELSPQMNVDPDGQYTWKLHYTDGEIPKHFVFFAINSVPFLQSKLYAQSTKKKRLKLLILKDLSPSASWNVYKIALKITSFQDALGDMDRFVENPLSPTLKWSGVAKN